MQVQNGTFEYPNTNFKAVYKVYHWHKPEGVWRPAFEDMSDVKTYQRKLTNILNCRSTTAKIIKQNDFTKRILDVIKEKDADFKAEPYVCSFPNYDGGFKTAWNGNVSAEACMYILTGKDAVDFKKWYSKPIEYAQDIAKQYDDARIGEIEVEQAKTSYGFGGMAYIRDKLGRFRDAVSGRPLELHAIYIGKTAKGSKLHSVKFFETNGYDNPLMKRGIIT